MAFVKRLTAEGLLFRFKTLAVFVIVLALNARPLVQRLFRRPRRETKGRRMVGLLSMYRPIFWHGPIFEMHVYRWLEARGFTPVFIICRGFVDVCDSQFFKANALNNPLLCSDCRMRHTAFFERNDVRVIALDEYVRYESVAAETEKIGRIRSIEEAGTYHYQGLPLGEIARLNVSRYYLRLTLDENHLNVYKQHLYAGVKLHSAFATCVKVNRFENFLIFNGRYLMHAVPLALIREARIPFTTYEMGDKESFLISHDEVSVLWSDVGAQYRQWRERETLPENWEQVLRDFEEQRKQLYVGTFTSLQETGPEEEIDLLCCTNVVWDSGVYGRDTIFANQFEWVRQLIAFCRDRELSLVIRIHPAESNVIYNKTCERMLDVIKQAYPVLPQRVRVVPPEASMSTYELMKRTRTVTVYSSSVGLEAAMQGKPVIVAGWAHYMGHGFTVDPRTRDDYFASLEDHARAGGSLPDQAEEARRYAYWYYLQYNKLNNIQLFGRPFHTPEDSLMLRVPLIETASASPELGKIMGNMVRSRPATCQALEREAGLPAQV